MGLLFYVLIASTLVDNRKNGLFTSALGLGGTTRRVTQRVSSIDKITHCVYRHKIIMMLTLRLFIDHKQSVKII